MNLYFDLSITQDGVLQIEDITQTFNEYLPEDNDVYITPGRFKYSETYTVNVIKYVSTKGVKVLDVKITSHVDEYGDAVFCDETYYPLLHDGHYVIDHLVIPNIECVENKINIADYDRIYTTDGHEFFKLTNGVLEKCSISELTEPNEYRTTISKAFQETFSLYRLNDTYLELCNQHLHKLMKNLCAKEKEAHDIELDLVWLSINAIKYNVEFGMLDQAQRLLEEIHKCTGIAKLVNNNLNTNNGYGCKCCL